MTNEKREEPFRAELVEADRALQRAVEAPSDAYVIWEAWQKRMAVVERQERACTHAGASSGRALGL